MVNSWWLFGPQAWQRPGPSWWGWGSFASGDTWSVSSPIGTAFSLGNSWEIHGSSRRFGMFGIFGMFEIWESDSPQVGFWWFLGHSVEVHSAASAVVARVGWCHGHSTICWSASLSQDVRNQVITTAPKSFTGITRLVWKMGLLFDMDYVCLVYALCSSLRVSLF